MCHEQSKDKKKSLLFFRTTTIYDSGARRTYKRGRGRNKDKHRGGRLQLVARKDIKWVVPQI